MAAPQTGLTSCQVGDTGQSMAISDIYWREIEANASSHDNGPNVSVSVHELMY